MARAAPGGAPCTTTVPRARRRHAPPAQTCCFSAPPTRARRAGLPLAELLEPATLRPVLGSGPPRARVVPQPAVLEHAVPRPLLADGIALPQPLVERPDRAPGGVEALVGLDRLLEQVIRRHLLGTEDDVLRIVERPVALEDAAVGVQLLELLRTGERREDVEHHRVDLVLLRELDGVAHGVRRVVIGAQHEHAVGADAVVVEHLDGVLDVTHRLRLLEAVEGGLVDRLEAEGDEVTLRGPHELQQFLVAHDVGAHLRAPRHGDTLVDHELQQPLEPLPVGGHVVVVEEDLLRVLLLDLGDHALGAAEAVLLAEHRRHRAEGAVERAAPAGHDRRVADPLVAVHEREVRERQRVEVLTALVQRRVHGRCRPGRGTRCR